MPAARDVRRYSGTCRSLAYAGEGALRRRHHEQQTEQMWCLTLATNAIVIWTTEYHGLAVAALRRPVHRRRGPGPHLAHPPRKRPLLRHPLRDVDGELAKLDADGYRPLRAITATEQVHP